MYTNEDGEIIVMRKLSAVAADELEQHWYRFGRDDYHDNKQILGQAFDERDGPDEARVLQATDVAIEEEDENTHEFIVDAYVRGWNDASHDDVEE